MNRLSKIRCHILATLGLVFLTMASSSGAQAALSAFMTATGEVRGQIIGSVDVAPYENFMEVVEFGHNISAGVMEGGFEPTGARQHRPIRVTKPVDKASMPLMQAMIDGEKLTSVTIRFIRPGSTGAEEQYLTIQLFNAYVVNIAQTQDSLENLAVPNLETLSLTYQRILWTWEPESLSAEDNWVSP